MKKIVFLIILFLLPIQTTFGNEGGYRLDTNKIVTVDKHNVCKKVNNSDSNSYFIPAKSSNEWSAFRNHLPNGTSLSECYTYKWQKSSSSNCNANPYWGNWSSCSENCGGGYMTRICNGKLGTKTISSECKRSDGLTVSDSYCSGNKPIITENCIKECVGDSWSSCNTQACSCYEFFGQMISFGATIEYGGTYIGSGRKGSVRPHECILDQCYGDANLHYVGYHPQISGSPRNTCADISKVESNSKNEVFFDY